MLRAVLAIWLLLLAQTARAEETSAPSECLAMAMTPPPQNERGLCARCPFGK
jgi:hypothetical protein